MDRLLRHRTRRNEIQEAEVRLTQHKRAVISRGKRVGAALREKLTEPGAFIIAGSVGYLIGEFSGSRNDTEKTPGSNQTPGRTPGKTFDDAIFWLKTAVALISWGSVALAAAADPDQEP